MNPVVRRVLFGNALAAIGSGLTLPLLIIYLGQVRGLGTTVGGFVVAYIAVVQLLLLPVAGILVDRLGPRPVLMGGLLVQGTGVALLTQVDSVPTAYAVATVISVGSAFSWGPQSALLGRLTTPAERTRIFGIQFMILNLGIGIGGIVAAVVVDVTDPATFELLYVMDALTYLLYVLVLATLRGVGVGRAPVEGQVDAQGGYREVLQDRRLVRIVALGLVLMTCGYGSLEVGLPVIVTVVNGLSVSWVAIAFAVNTATIVVVQLFTLRTDRGAVPQPPAGRRGRAVGRLVAPARHERHAAPDTGDRGDLPLDGRVRTGRDAVRADHALPRERPRPRTSPRPLQRRAEHHLGRVGSARASHRGGHAGRGPRGGLARPRRRRAGRRRRACPETAADPDPGP